MMGSGSKATCPSVSVLLALGMEAHACGSNFGILVPQLKMTLAEMPGDVPHSEICNVS